MSLKTTHAPGEPIKSADMNSVVSLAIQNAHNIFELFLENYFAAKITAFLGLFFDGFSDTVKADTTATTLTATAASGQAILTISDTTGFKIGHNIVIFDSTNREEKVIQSVDSSVQLTLTTNLANTFNAGAPVERSGVTFDVGLKKIFLQSRVFVQPPVFDASSFFAASDPTPLSFTHTASGSNRFVIITTHLKTSTNTVTAVTYGGIPATFLLSISRTIINGENTTVVYTLVNPPTGAQTVVITRGSNNAIGAAMSYTGVDQASPIGATATTQAQTTNVTTNITTLQNKSLLVDAFTKLSIALPTVGAGQTQRFQTLNTNSQFNGQGSDKGAPTASPNSMSWTFGLAHHTHAVMEVRGITQTANLKQTDYFSKLQSFQTAMADVRLWVTRNFTAQFNLDANISAGATTLTILGDQTGKYANGNTIDLSTPDNLTRERKTLTAVPSFGGGVTTLTFSATTNAFTTADFVERVDVLPQISIVDKDAAESLSAMTFIKSIVDFANSEVEDEYSFAPGTPNEDVVVKLDLTREDVTLIPEAKRLGVTLNE